MGYLAPITLDIAINLLFPHSFRYTLVNAPMFVCGSLMSAVVIATMS